jgi:hypothetical protein
MKWWLILALGFSSLRSFANTLDCEIKLNDEVKLQTRVETMLGEKTSIGKFQGLAAYVTEKPNRFHSLEVFLPDYEARIYGEAYLKASKDRLVATLWGREMLVEVLCEQVSARK